MSRRQLLPAHGRSAASARSSKRRLLRVCAGAAALVLSATIVPGATAATPRIIVGAAGDATGLSRSIGAPLAYSGYGQMSGNVPNAKMVNMKATTSWRNVANATSGSTYDHIVRWARTLKGRPGPILFAFHHEPEAKTNLSYGTATDYIAAYRRVVDIFRQQGVANVEHTWQMTSWAFTVSSSDRRSAPKWYPGSSYVDNVGTDPYNWYNCPTNPNPWTDLKPVMDDSLAFARAYGKRLVVAEFGSQADPARRAQWLRNARQYFIANRATIRAVFYFQLNMDSCSWRLTTSSELSAMREMATDATNFTSS